jgi:opacity protein-like surface antigen
MRKTNILIILSIFLCANASAQRWSLGLGTGFSQYIGDIRDESAATMLRPTAAVGFHYKTAGRLHWSFNGTVTSLKAEDANTDNKARGLSFNTTLAEVSVLARVDLRKGKRITPYLTAGTALFFVDPWAEAANGDKVKLYPLSTGGQGLSQYPDVKDHSKANLALPFGGGFDFALAKGMHLEFDVILRKTFTDYIDDLGSIYPDRAALTSARGAQAVTYAWRGTGAYPAAGSARGDADDKDWYSSFNIRLKVPLKKSK